MSQTTALILVDLQVAAFGGLGIQAVHRADRLLGNVERFSRQLVRLAFPLFTSSAVPVPATCSQREHLVGRYSRRCGRRDESVVQKRVSDAFEGTDLHARLRGIGARSVVVAGIQTEHCVAATCRGALRLGYTVHLAEDGHSTWPDEPRSVDDIMAAESAALKADGVALHSTEHLVELLRSRRSVHAR
jgi:nicotinamidase-related amidase